MDKRKLQEVSLFSVLSDEELDKVCSVSSARNYSKGEMIFFETEPYLGFYVVLEGSIKIFKITGDGREHIIHFVYPFNTFAEVPMFEQYEKIQKDEFSYPANAMSLESDTRLMLVRAGAFYELLRNNHEISLKMLSALSKRLRHLNTYIERRTKDVPHRLAEYLVRECMKGPHDANESIEIDISKHDLASYLGTINETLSRAFKKFQDEGLIVSKGKHIIVNDIKKLKKLAYE